MSRTVEFEAISDLRCNLGEGPVWSDRDNALYWVDIRRPAIHCQRFATDTLQTWTMPDLISSLAVRESGGLLVALRSALSTFDSVTCEIIPLAAPEKDRPTQRFNDGKCDRAGRFWVGTMNDKVRGDPSGALYRLDAQHRCTKWDEAIGTPNSLAWSPDDRTMYFADSFLGLIYAYDFDREAGTISNRRVHIDLSDGPGVPDGSTVDADGFLWNAQYGAGRLNRYAPDGRLERSVALPVSQPTSCAFGGPDLSILFVTSASQRMTEQQLAREPLAGAVLACDVGRKGLLEPRYVG